MRVPLIERADGERDAKSVILPGLPILIREYHAPCAKDHGGVW